MIVHYEEFKEAGLDFVEVQMVAYPCIKTNSLLVLIMHGVMEVLVLYIAHSPSSSWYGAYSMVWYIIQGILGVWYGTYCIVWYIIQVVLGVIHTQGVL